MSKQIACVIKDCTETVTVASGVGGDPDLGVLRELGWRKTFDGYLCDVHDRAPQALKTRAEIDEEIVEANQATLVEGPREVLWHDGSDLRREHEPWCDWVRVLTYQSRVPPYPDRCTCDEGDPRAGDRRADPSGEVGEEEERYELLPTDSQERKDVPMARGCLDYFPAALAEVARLSKHGNDKHNPGEEMHHARGKSMDHADCIMRHLTERGVADTDGFLHDVKVAWRALAMLQEALEARGAPLARGAREAS